jgi:antitoxin component YwqK of YwqJK toxin-antitoxin module
MEGKWTEYFMDGSKRTQGTMKSGEMIGNWIFWYNSGNKECEFFKEKDDFINATVYHDNGKIKDTYKV